MTLSAFRALPDEDRTLALAFDLYEADLCPGCGQPRTYAHDTDSAGHWHGSDAIRCNACTALEASRRKYDKNDGSKAPLYFTVQPDDLLVYAMEHPLPRD